MSYASNVMRSIPQVLKSSQAFEVYGHPDFNLLYGYYELGSRSWARKMIQAIRNGTGR